MENQTIMNIPLCLINIMKGLKSTSDGFYPVIFLESNMRNRMDGDSMMKTMAVKDELKCSLSELG